MEEDNEESVCESLENDEKSLHDKKDINDNDFETRQLIIKIRKKEKTLQELRRNVLKRMDVTVDDVHTKQMLTDIGIMDKKIAFIRNENTKRKGVIKAARREEEMCDKLIEKLRNEDKLMDLAIQKTIGIDATSDSEQDIENYIKCVHDKIKAREKERAKEELKLKKRRKSLERKKKMLNIYIQNTYRQDEEIFNSEIPRHENNNNNNNNLYANNSFSKDDSQISRKLMNIVKNNNTDSSSSLDYKLPENVTVYTAITDTLPTREELAVNYVLKTSGYNEMDKFLKFIEHTKTDVDNLYDIISVKSVLWKLLIDRHTSAQEINDNLNLMTNKEIEFNKKIDCLKSIIDDQDKEISECEKTKNRYLSLFDDMYFSLYSVSNIVKKMNILTDDETNANDNYASDDEELVNPNLKYVEDITSMINEIDKIIVRCNKIIPDEWMFDPERLNTARALNVYKSQIYAQEQLLQRKAITKEMLEKTRANLWKDDDEYVRTRKNAKKQSKKFVKNIRKKKDKDEPKPKRQPISSRARPIRK